MKNLNNTIVLIIPNKTKKKLKKNYLYVYIYKTDKIIYV